MGALRKLSKIKDLVGRAGSWLGRAAAAPAVRHEGAVTADRFDTMTWRETYEQAPALQELREDLNTSFDYTADLLGDVFHAAHKVAPRLREAEQMDPARLPNRQIVASLLARPEFTDLRQVTAGDPYAAAMAVVAQSDELRRMLQHSKDAQDAAQADADARQAAETAADRVAEALAQADEAADTDGTVPADHTTAVEQAMQAARAADAAAAATQAAAEQARTQAAGGLKAAARTAAANAAEAAREEQALMRAWGVGPGQLQRMDFHRRAELAQRLRSGRLARFAELIGRFRQMAFGERARRVENAPGELVGVTLGDDLSRVVPAELAQLALPATRAIFASRYAQGELMLFDSRGEQDSGQGAIIACIDGSHSMTWRTEDSDITGEAWAKAVALALLDQARQAKRDFVGIHFASANEVRAFHFPAGAPPSIADVIDFAEHFFDGGTDFESPLTTAVEVLQEQFDTDGRPRGDIVLITDGECGVTEEWMRTWNEARHALGFRCFGIAVNDSVDTGPESVLDALCDNLRTVKNLADPGHVADLFRVI